MTTISFPHLAVSSSDYSNFSSILIFTSGSTDNATRCMDVVMLDDNALEANQTLTVTLSTSDANVILGYWEIQFLPSPLQIMMVSCMVNKDISCL